MKSEENKRKSYKGLARLTYVGSSGLKCIEYNWELADGTILTHYQINPSYIEKTKARSKAKEYITKTRVSFNDDKEAFSTRVGQIFYIEYTARLMKDDSSYDGRFFVNVDYIYGRCVTYDYSDPAYVKEVPIKKFTDKYRISN